MVCAATAAACTGVIEEQSSGRPGRMALPGPVGGGGAGGASALGGSGGLGGSAGSGGTAPLVSLWTGSMGSWCGPGDNATLWLVSNMTATACATQSEQIYGETVMTTDGLTVEVPSTQLMVLPATLTLPSRYCSAGVCSMVNVSLTVDSFTQGVGATGSWSLTPPGGVLVEGRLEAGWCAWDDFLPAHPDGTRLARDIELSEIAVYQGVKVPIMSQMQAVDGRNADLVQNREALVRVFVEPREAFQSREIAARLTLDDGDGEPLVLEEAMVVDAGSS
jgi:hypothetical protein